MIAIKKTFYRLFFFIDEYGKMIRIGLRLIKMQIINSTME